MSADNGIYILKSKTDDEGATFVYRVANIHAIENFLGRDVLNQRMIKEAFAGSPDMKSPDEAMAYARRLEAELEAAGLEVEYGILQLETIL